jgi:hypothetical protein
MYQLTIIGDRQSGRSRILIDMAIDHAARHHETVLYQCPSRTEAHCALKMAQDRTLELVPKAIRCVHATNGRERITFNKGGVIDFVGDELWSTGKKIGLHCMDGVACEPYPNTERAVRAVLR